MTQTETMIAHLRADPITGTLHKTRARKSADAPFFAISRIKIGVEGNSLNQTATGTFVEDYRFDNGR